MYEIKICHLYPDLLNLYGDRGNIMALTKRCEWRGIRADYIPVTLGDPFKPEDYDIILIGGGQDYEQAIIQDDLMNDKKDAVKEAVQAGKVILAICGGLQLLGKYFRTHKGEDIECIGALDLWTIGSHERLTGNLIFECDFLKTDSFDGLVVGFENHSGKTYRGPDVKPLGKVIRGFGANGEDGYEGAIYKNVFCSYSHGSLLPKNPALTDHLLSLALKNKYEGFEVLEKLDDSFETRANESLIRRFLPTRV